MANLPLLVNPATSFAGSAQELIPTRTGVSFDSSGNREYERKFRVRAISREIGAATAVLCNGIPLPYSPYVSPDGTELDQLAVAVNYSAEREDPNKFENWVVTVRYSTAVPEGGIPALVGFGPQVVGAHNQPWLQRPRVEWDWEETTYYPSRDLDGKAYANSAYMPFSPAPGFPAAYPILTITRWERTWTRQLASRYSFAVNSDVVLGAKASTVLSMPPRVSLEHRGTLTYFKVIFRLKFNLPKRYRRENAGQDVFRGDPNIDFNDLQTWQPEILDKGTHQLPVAMGVPFRGQPIPIIRYGAPVTRDVLLNGEGREAKQVQPGVAGSPIPPTFINFREFHNTPLIPIISTGIGGDGAEPVSGGLS